MVDDEAFFSRLADLAGTAHVSPPEIKAVLDFARVIAHTQERRYAPVASYALGLTLTTADPVARVEAIRRAIAAVQAMSTGVETPASDARDSDG
jgi:hypothetical protein